jgi:hypothetical protein
VTITSVVSAMSLASIAASTVARQLSLECTARVYSGDIQPWLWPYSSGSEKCTNIRSGLVSAKYSPARFATPPHR